jgi:transcription elongation factor GreA
VRIERCARDDVSKEGAIVSETTQATWLTQEAFDRLKDELARLEGAGRAEVTERIATARDEGDLKENGGYHAAREEQAKQEARIRELKMKLRNVQVGVPLDDGVVLLGSREIAGSADIEVFSPTSPLGAAISGCTVGDIVTYKTPTGTEITVVISGAKPFIG